MGTEPEPNTTIEKSEYMNNLDESYGFLCLSISKYLLLHLSGSKSPKEVCEQIANLFGKQDELRVY